MAVAVSCRSWIRKARMDCTMLLRTPLRGVSEISGRSGVSISVSFSVVKNSSRFIRGSLHDLSKAGVMVSGVITGMRRPRRSTAHDATGPTGVGTRGPHGVFAVVAALAGRELALPVAEHRAVLLMRERPSQAD